jgi:hypothetical protein
MEKQLDDIADGALEKNEVIKPFYDYIKEQINKIVPIQYEKSANFKPPEVIGKYNKFNITLNNGKFGQYITCDTYKFNLASLFQKNLPNKSTNELNDDLDNDLDNIDEADINNDDLIDNSESDNEDGNLEEKSEIDLDNIDNDTIVQKVIEKIEQLKNDSGKEWKIGKKKYILKNGAYGYYVEEWNITTKKKTSNYSIKFLMNKIAKANELDPEDSSEIIKLIENKDIEETIEYMNNNKNKPKKFIKKIK